MMWLLYILIILIILDRLIWLGARLAIRFKPRHSEKYEAITEDGVHLKLFRYLPQNAAVSHLPVLLLHGMSSNHYNMDSLGEGSLAKYLQEQGFEAWAADFRGCGDSQSPGWSRDADRYDFDRYVSQDLPALIRKVLEITGKKRLHLLGHSMGGMSLYAYLGLNPEAPAASATAVASPAGIRIHGRDAMFGGLSRFASGLAMRFPLLPFKLWGRLFFHVAPLYFHSPASGLAVAGNWTLRQNWAFSYYAASDFPSGLIRQAVFWLQTGRFTSRDGQKDYAANLSRVTTPFMILVSQGERLVNRDDILKAYDLLPENGKRRIIIGRETGFKREYGHIDLLTSDGAREEVYPRLVSWFREHETGPKI